ncbi:MAG: hypothetical protein EXS63_00695 [Candidatus Omnitrophica bacterium]|nr:hypothetical protein [Candidatus Omnitrophota bacterium]
MFERKMVGMCNASRLGAIRILVLLTALFYVLWENFPVFSEVPFDWYRPIGFMMFVPRSMMAVLLSSSVILAAFKLLLVVFLLMALVGCQTRWSLLAATVMYFIYISVPRAYAWFFHTGLLPFYLMFFMLWLPVEDGLSWDQSQSQKKGRSGEKETQQVIYGWSVFLLRAVMAGCYFQAGYAKLHNSGLEWFAPWNLKHHILQDTLGIMHFRFQVGLGTIHWPDGVWILLSAAAVFSELFYPVILFSWHLRMIYPLIGMMLHGFILLLQNIFFPDLIILQLIFYDWDRILNLNRFPWHDRRGTVKRPKTARSKTV